MPKSISLVQKSDGIEVQIDKAKTKFPTDWHNVLKWVYEEVNEVIITEEMPVP